MSPGPIVSGLTVTYIRRIYYHFVLLSRTPACCSYLVATSYESGSNRMCDLHPLHLNPGPTSGIACRLMPHGGASRFIQKPTLGLKKCEQMPHPKRQSNNYGNTLNWLSYRVFSHDVTSAILVSQNNETAAMLVSQTNPLGGELFSYASDFFCSKTFA